MLYRSTDRLRRRGAPVENLAHSASFHSAVKSAPSNSGIKHSAHKVSGVREAIEGVGARLRYLPACSPDSKPIKQLFAKVKALLRTAAARTVADLWPGIRHAFTRFTADECRNYLAAAGYNAYDPS